MSIKIKAEFPTVDDAEFAIRAIKQTVENVGDINVRQRSSAVFNNYFTSAVPLGSGIRNHAHYYNPEFADLNVRNRALEIGRETVVEVVCENTAVRQVEQKLTAYGGLKIMRIV